MRRDRQLLIQTLQQHGLSALAARLERVEAMPAHVAAAIAVLRRAELLASRNPQTGDIAAQISQVLYRLQSGDET